MNTKHSSYYAGHVNKKKDNNIINCIRGENPINEKFFPKELIKNVDFYRYPDPLSQKLRDKIALDTGFSPENILCTNGSDEGLMLLMLHLLSSEDEIIICPPTFFNYIPFAKLARANVISILRKNDYSLNIEKILSSITKKTKLIVIDSPGNPCGVLIKREAVIQLLKTGINVIIDEAYFEYCQQTVSDLIKTYPNLIVTRSFSKWAGLAGLRVGYVIARKDIIDGLTHAKVPCNVNPVGQYFASYALDHKEEFMKRLEEIINLRELAVQRLSQNSDITVLSSHTAFFIIKLNNIGNAFYAQEYLEKKNILVMALNQPLLENSLRVNVGTPEALESFCSVFEKWISIQKGNSR